MTRYRLRYRCTVPQLYGSRSCQVRNDQVHVRRRQRDGHRFAVVGFVGLPDIIESVRHEQQIVASGVAVDGNRCVLGGRVTAARRHGAGLEVVNKNRVVRAEGRILREVNRVIPTWSGVVTALVLNILGNRHRVTEFDDCRCRGVNQPQVYSSRHDVVLELLQRQGEMAADKLRSLSARSDLLSAAHVIQERHGRLHSAKQVHKSG